MKYILFSFCCLFVQYSFGQSIQLGEKIEINLEDNITLRDACVINGEILVVGQVRNNGDIDSYLATFDQQGKISKSFSISDKNVFSQFVKVIESNGGYYLLENNSDQSGSTIKVYHFNLALEEVSHWVITEKHSNIGRDLQFLSPDNLLVAVWDGFNSIRSYPVIYNLNLISGQKMNVDLDKANSRRTEDLVPNESWNKEQKESFQELADYEKSKMIKQVNKLIVDGEDVYVLGSENTDNISDYWICNLDKELKIKWEKTYEDKNGFGADWLLDGYIKNDKLNLTGDRYRKGKSGYDFNYLVLSRAGVIENDKFHDLGQHEVSAGMIDFETCYLEYGIILENTVSYSYNDVSKDKMLVMLLDERGNVLDQKEKEIPGLDKIKKGLKINSTSFLLLGEEEINSQKRHFFINGQLLSKQIKP